MAYLTDNKQAANQSQSQNTSDNKTLQRKGETLMPPNAQNVLQLKAMIANSLQPQAIQLKALQEQMLHSPEGQRVQQLKAIIASSPQMQRAAQLQAMANSYAAQQQTPIQRMGKEEEMLQGKFSKQAPIQLHQRTTGKITGTKTENNTDSIESVRREIARHEPIPPNQNRLILNTRDSNQNNTGNNEALTSRLQEISGHMSLRGNGNEPENQQRFGRSRVVDNQVLDLADGLRTNININQNEPNRRELPTIREVPERQEEDTVPLFRQLGIGRNANEPNRRELSTIREIPERQEEDTVPLFRQLGIGRNANLLNRNDGLNTHRLPQRQMHNLDAINAEPERERIGEERRIRNLNRNATRGQNLGAFFTGRDIVDELSEIGRDNHGIYEPATRRNRRRQQRQRRLAFGPFIGNLNRRLAEGEITAGGIQGQYHTRYEGPGEVGASSNIGGIYGMADDYVNIHGHYGLLNANGRQAHHGSMGLKSTNDQYGSRLNEHGRFPDNHAPDEDDFLP